jgi:hypothetical protein
MCSDDIGYAEGVGSSFHYFVEGRADVGDSWTTLSVYADKASANNRLADLKGGPYNDVRIVRRTLR